MCVYILYIYIYTYASVYIYIYQYFYIYMYIHICVMVRDLAGVVLGCADCAVSVLLAFFCYTQVVLDIYMQGAAPPQHRLLSYRGLVIEASLSQDSLARLVQLPPCVGVTPLGLELGVLNHSLG
jgi:hypothetical protein